MPLLRNFTIKENKILEEQKNGERVSKLIIIKISFILQKTNGLGMSQLD